jgi:hypothetical protein
MVCKSPLRLSCNGLDIGGGFLYRNKGTLVREKDTEGISCRSSIYTQEIAKCTISDWRPGDACRKNQAHSVCDGKGKPEKVFKWNTSIDSFRNNEDAAEIFDFTAIYNPTRCDKTHCLILISSNGHVVQTFSELSEQVRMSLDLYLKRVAIR